jgi:hypothetical protein
LRREIRLPKTARMALIGIGVLVFAIGSFVPSATGGILALVSALLVVFMFLFTTSKTTGESGPGKEERPGDGEGRASRGTDRSIHTVLLRIPV